MCYRQLGDKPVDEADVLAHNAGVMHAPRFTFAFYYRYWFTNSGRGEARARKVRMQT
jgi:hypothetical protein